MEPTRESLRENYQNKETYELVELLDKGDLTELAKSALIDELTARQEGSSEGLADMRKEAYEPESFKEPRLELTKYEIIYRDNVIGLSNVKTAKRCRVTKWWALIVSFIGFYLMYPLANFIGRIIDPTGITTATELSRADYVSGAIIVIQMVVFTILLIYGFAGGKGLKIKTTSNSSHKIPFKKAIHIDLAVRAIENYPRYSVIEE